MWFSYLIFLNIRFCGHKTANTEIIVETDCRIFFPYHLHTSTFDDSIMYAETRVIFIFYVGNHLNRIRENLFPSQIKQYVQGIASIKAETILDK